ncbi:hypothetical protein EW15_0435 [Prochlorococcus sp. MIT 0801]|nr:hypothetical protein EW15_0435 [Prochlorococcus sp. MIT 0801]
MAFTQELNMNSVNKEFSFKAKLQKQNYASMRCFILSNLCSFQGSTEFSWIKPWEPSMLSTM